ncbi:MarR family winged helix-turn-helix transcriptional regulator [Clostridium magnum]|uniref:HTH-type transcriptional regulator MhqR n=2 Tax=Clostridium magnum TaxID=33954 RepID=A0A162RPJ3_9CLOT|nr:MarR family transcriptional regulator [Clostridium magnum]KZL90203.1 HTH-type transcriptional regulator MhqR [Clostridium magnum DSM 2767]SHH64375.1 DNA-binding transcriptional regulator, MarR family [Clostridium magnum DSM 2767]
MNNEKAYELIKELMLVFKLLNRKVSHKIDCKKVNMTSIMILKQLSTGGQKTLTEISESLGLPNSTASVLVDKLVKQGMLTRVRDVDDRRKVLICITDKAMELEEKISGEFTEYLKELINPATDEEVETIFKGLETLTKVIENGDQMK